MFLPSFAKAGFSFIFCCCCCHCCGSCSCNSALGCPSAVATPWLSALMTVGVSVIVMLSWWCSVIAPHRTDFFFGRVDAWSPPLSLLMRPGHPPLVVIVAAATVDAAEATAEVEQSWSNVPPQLLPSCLSSSLPVPPPLFNDRRYCQPIFVGTLRGQVIVVRGRQERKWAPCIEILRVLGVFCCVTSYMCTVSYIQMNQVHKLL